MWICGWIWDWVTIVQLTDTAEITKLGLKPLNGIAATDDGGDSFWTSKISNNASGAAVTLDAKAMYVNPQILILWLMLDSPPGAPAGAKAGVQYTCGASRGAVLLSRGPVTRAWLTGVGEMKTWMSENIDDLVKKGDFDCIKKRGLWVVSKIHHASEAAKTVFQ